MRRGVKIQDPMFLGPEERWRALGVAVVRQAVWDWKEAVVKLNNPKTIPRVTREMDEQKRSAEHFISSPLCEFYSGLNGKMLLRKIKESM